MLRAFRLRPRRERFPVAPFPTGVSAPAPAGSCWVSLLPSTTELSPSSVAEGICRYGGIEVSAWFSQSGGRSGLFDLSLGLWLLLPRSTYRFRESKAGTVRPVGLQASRSLESRSSSLVLSEVSA